MSQTLASQTAADTPLSAERLAQIQEAFAKNPTTMTVQLARQFGIPERDVLRALPEGRAVELDAARWQDLLGAFAPLGQVHVIVSNGSATLESFGQFGNISSWGGYVNVQTKSLDMHIRQNAIGSVFAVKKQSHMDGVETLSVQFFNHEGHSAFKVFLTFGSKPPTDERTAQHQAICDSFRPAR